MAAAPVSPRPIVRANRSAFVHGAISILLLVIGMEFGNNGLVLISCAALAHLALCYRFARRNLRGLTVRRSLAPPIFAGARFRSTLRLTRTSGSPGVQLLLHDQPIGRGVPRLPPTFFSATDRIAAGETLELRQEGLFFRRGKIRFALIEVTSRFPLGLFTSRLELPCADEVVVYPQQLEIPRRLLPQALDREQYRTYRSPRSGHDDFAGLREYRPGDNPRRIHWRASARVPDRILVRVFERTPALDVTLRFDAAVEDPSARSRGRFEHGVQVAASLARALVREGHSVRFLLRHRELEEFHVRATDRSLDALLERLALVDALRESELVAIDDDSFAAHGPTLVLRPADLDPRANLATILDWRRATKESVS